MTSIYDSIDLAHFLVVTYEDHRDRQRLRAECSCGWAGDWRDDGAMAEADGDDHREVAVGPGDGLDRVMGELLDLQDDLARAVMWLAEHWSADLPAPHGGGSGPDSARVDLAAYCATAELLDMAAGVLGVSLVDDPAPDAGGNRFRRATRPFGRVRLTVYRALAAACDECGAEITGDVCPECRQRSDARPVTLGAA
jgi:hypothetical protein